MSARAMLRLAFLHRVRSVHRHFLLALSPSSITSSISAIFWLIQLRASRSPRFAQGREGNVSSTGIESKSAPP